MYKTIYFSTMRLFMAVLFSMFCAIGMAQIVVNVATAGTLASLLDGTEAELKLTGFINGDDVICLRKQIKEGKLTLLDLSEVRIVAGGEAYYDSYTTDNDVIGPYMFNECTNLRRVLLPETATGIRTNAFSRTGLTEVDIPANVIHLGVDAFGYCNSLNKVTIGRKVSKMDQGVFYASPVKNVYVKNPAPAATPRYFFSSNPTIQVFSSALSDYLDTDWTEYGTVVGGLEEIYPEEKTDVQIVREAFEKYFEDAACTELKAEYQAMTDAELTDDIAAAGLPDYISTIALKIKNSDWADYEKDFRIHSYKAYSDARYWNDKLKSTGGSYMGNPTGIYCADDEPFYVFVNDDIPDDATLYIAGCVANTLIYNAKTGTKLKKGFNMIEGEKDALYYILYIADTRSQTKTLSEWPDMKIHIEGGVVNGYYDVSRHSDEDYKALLNAATHDLFTIRGSQALFNFKRTTYKSVFPATIDKSIIWFDSLTVWEKELMGFCESVASGQRAMPPYCLTGGDAIFPLYYNNPNFAIEGKASDAGWANSVPYRTSYNSVNCISSSFKVSREDHDEWCAAHECGHNNQGAINLEGGTEVSNNLFSNVVRYLTGIATSSGLSLTATMNDYARHKPWFIRDVSSTLRMYYQLYLYYHQAQNNTAFYPTLFKALREDPLTLWTDTNNSSLKFVRKVCEVAQEDLTEFFEAWGFFEPCSLTIDDYGTRSLTVKLADIMRTKAEIAKYPKKNRTILFIEDRVDYVPTTDFLTTPDQKRRGSDIVGQCGDLGQFTDYLPGAGKPSNYTYLQSDSLYAMLGEGGIGFMVLNKAGKMLYASNSKAFCIPRSVGKDFAIYSIDADGSLHETTRSGYGTEYVTLKKVSTLSDSLSSNAIKAVISGPLCGTDVKYLRELVTDGFLSSLDMTDAKISIGGLPYYESYRSTANTIGSHTFHNCSKLTSIILPTSALKIGERAFTSSGLRTIEIPDGISSIGYDAFAYCGSLSQVILGSGLKKLEQGAFYSSPITDAYVKALTPPEVGNYLFSSKPTIHVYASALEDYQNSRWAEYGTIVGDLDRFDNITGINDSRQAAEEAAAAYHRQDSAIYSLSGRKVMDPKPDTIYIIDGKKIKY